MPAKKAAEQKVDLNTFKQDQQLQSRAQQLLPFEKKLNSDWVESKIYEVDAPPAPKPGESEPGKYFVTFPYPYMNGRLHLGHLFTFSKCEFAARYHRMKGEFSLLPFGFHCTGMPIKASADKLALELDRGIKVTSSSTHSKAAAKTETGVSQFDILRHMEVPESEIPEFRDPQKWLKYFPPLGKEDLIHYGSCVDWRRSFITTDANPYYDHFVQWQFRILKEKGLVKFGKRPTIYSMKDQQPCMDHDRASGEGVQPQEYTLIKLQLVDPKAVDERFDGSVPVFMLAATLRPETMVGQTNYWVKPGVKYEVARSADKKEMYITGARSLKNLAAQKFVESFESLFQIDSDKLIGALATHKAISHQIRGFPLPDIKMNKGTGIVTCVPSDAPADEQGIQDLIKIKELREKYNVDPEWLKFDPILIIHTDKYGDYTAKAVLEELKTSSMPKAEKLEEAKKIAYKEGFYHGVMIAGPFKGEKVTIAKEKAKQRMIEEGSALLYYEPESVVISRSNDECVVMLCDQWYIEYGQEEWKRKVVEHFKANVECFHNETREKFLSTFEWLGPWACSRQFGLGTKMPFSQEFLIDSLSDSTIYTAYYTIAHLLQGCLDGSQPGLGGLKPDQINDEFFNYVFLNGPLPAGADEAVLQRFRREFEFWYPVNCRASGKDLVTNHLTMYLYNHAAIFPPDKWPVGIRANGHLKLNNEKMSKSTGNFLTAVEAIELFSVTGVRIGLADAGDAADDANFDGTVVKSALTRLSTFTEFVKSKPEKTHEGIVGFADELLDARLSRAIKEADAAYKAMMFKAALKASFFELQNFWTEYTSMVQDSISSTLRERYINTFLLLLTPIIPHYTEYIWKEVLGHKDSIVIQKFPTASPYNPDIFYMDRLLRKTADTIKFRVRALKKVKNLNTAGIFIRTNFNEIQLHVLSLLRGQFDAEKNEWKSTLDEAINKDEYLNNIKKESKNAAQKFMPFLQFMKSAVPEFGAFLLNEKPEINQEELFRNNIQYFLRQLPGVTTLEIYNVDNGTAETPLWDQQIANNSQVYIPTANLCSK